MNLRVGGGVWGFFSPDVGKYHILFDVSVLRAPAGSSGPCPGRVRASGADLSLLRCRHSSL